MKAFILLTASMLFVSTNETYSQQKQVLKGTVERIKVHGKGLEGNLSGDSADRSVSIYLPPSYRSNPTRRYPVVYFLHGYTDDDAKWYGFTKHWINLPFIIDSAILKGEAKEMIIVTPNAYSRFQGSWYSNSITTGNWEDFVAKELVTYIDTHYRTIAKASARGISGHSMGGYGALRIGEKHPEVFSSVYLLSPAALKQRAPFTLTQSISRADSTKTYEDFLKADFGTKVIFSEAAAWSPNLNNPPFYVDLPYKNGQLQQDVIDKWTANMPLTTIDQYTTNFKQLKAIAFDAGTKDEAIAASIKVLDEELNKYNIKHLFEIYEGNHTNKIGERIKQKMLPFFSTNLMFEKK